MASGVFDLLHPGHLHFLREAKKLGDELVVVVARDATAAKNGKTLVFDENTRLNMVSELRIVDRAVLGHEGDIYQTVKDLRPDVIALGFDQGFSPEEVKSRSRQIGVDLKVVRITRYSHPRASSSKIREMLLSEMEGRN
ncbi:MAG: FAD synthase [Candidatus Thermoplasmatota archaeon]|nr:FAD synthase [Candidatus Thermoplasmatota archaeon]